MPIRASSSGSFADQDAVTGTFHLRIMILRLSRQGISPAICSRCIARARASNADALPCMRRAHEHAGLLAVAAGHRQSTMPHDSCDVLGRDAGLGGRDAEANPATVACVPARLRERLVARHAHR